MLCCAYKSIVSSIIFKPAAHMLKYIITKMPSTVCLHMSGN